MQVKINFPIPEKELTKKDKQEMWDKVREIIRQDTENGKIDDIYTYDMNIIMKRK